MLSNKVATVWKQRASLQVSKTEVAIHGLKRKPNKNTHNINVDSKKSYRDSSYNDYILMKFKLILS